MSFYENDEYIEAKNKLKDEYAVCYQKAAAYIQASNYGQELEENCLMQILDDFLSAQAEQKPVARIIGPNLRKFCDDMIKAEFERISDRKIYIFMQTAGIILCVPLLIIMKTFVFEKKAFVLDNLLHLNFGGFEILFCSIFILYYIIKKLVSVAFFNHAGISKLLSRALFIVSIALANVLSRFIDHYIIVSIPLPLPILMIVTISALTVFIICLRIDRKRRIKPVITEYEEIDHIDHIICPECGKEYDCDYPRCPYCKHKYMEEEV
jgi:DNA-binding ferritin-like protein (Dps family)